MNVRAESPNAPSPLDILQRRIAELEAMLVVRDGWRKRMQASHDSLYAENAELRNALHAEEMKSIELRKDAARYRWLREKSDIGFSLSRDREWCGGYYPNELDSSIDEAMGEQP